MKQWNSDEYHAAHKQAYSDIESEGLAYAQRIAASLASKTGYTAMGYRDAVQSYAEKH